MCGEVKKDWMESVERWKEMEQKGVQVVKKVERIEEIKVHMSKDSSFEVNGGIIKCSEAWQSWIIDQELKSV